MKKKLKNPIMIIRKPEEINKEYTDLVLKLGAQVLELKAIAKRELMIDEQQDQICDQVRELSLEMDEAQKEIQKKEEEVKKLNPELPLKEEPHNDT